MEEKKEEQNVAWNLKNLKNTGAKDEAFNFSPNAPSDVKS